MRKKANNMKSILLLLTITASMYICAGCGDGAQNDSAVPPVQDNLSAEQSADTGDDKEQATGEKQGSDTKKEQEEPEQVQSDDTPDQPEGKSDDVSASDAANSSPNESTELSIDVESVGDNSVVGNKIFIEPGIDGNSGIMVIGVGEDNKVLVTVHFAEDASYIYRIIRNGGEDVETREGSFLDIKNGLALHLTGYYKDEDFYADKVVISDVRID